MRKDDVGLQVPIGWVAPVQGYGIASRWLPKWMASREIIKKLAFGRGVRNGENPRHRIRRCIQEFAKPWMSKYTTFTHTLFRPGTMSCKLVQRP